MEPRVTYANFRSAIDAAVIEAELTRMARVRFPEVRRKYPDGAILHFDATEGFIDQTGNQTAVLIGDAYPTVTAGFAVNAAGKEWGFSTDTGPVKAALESGEVTLVQVVTLPLMSTLDDATDYSLFGDLLFVRRDGTSGSLKISDGTNESTVAIDWEAGDTLTAVAKIDNLYAFIARADRYTGVRRYGLCVSGDFAENASITGHESVLSKSGTATVTVSDGRVTFGEGTLWSFSLDNGSRYEFPILTDSANAIWYDVSGMGRDLVVTASSVSDHCAESTEFGSDWLVSTGGCASDNLVKQSGNLASSLWLLSGGATKSAGNVLNFAADGNSYTYQLCPNIKTGDEYVATIVLQGDVGRKVRIYITGTTNQWAVYTLTGGVDAFNLSFTANAQDRFSIRNNWGEIAHSVTLHQARLRRASSPDVNVATQDEQLYYMRPFYDLGTFVTTRPDFAVGVFTDTHYSGDGNGGSDQATNIPAIVENFSDASCDAVLSLGDTYHGDDWGSESEMETDVTAFEGLFSGLDANVAFVTGNHEKPYTYDLWNFSAYSRKNFTLDHGKYRIIAFFNSDNHYFSASPETLSWLEGQLSAAKDEGKAVILATHARVDKDWPGSPIKFTTGPDLPGVISQSSTSGSGVALFSSIASFSPDDIGKTIYALYGTSWGSALITGYVSAYNVTVDIIVPFASTGSADQWGYIGYSEYAYNADEIRTVIESAINGGTDVRVVLQGHTHVRDTNANVSGLGVNYETFASSNIYQNGYILYFRDNYYEVYEDQSFAEVGAKNPLYVAEYLTPNNVALLDSIPTDGQPCKGHTLPIGVGKITVFDGVASASQIAEAVE